MLSIIIIEKLSLVLYIIEIKGQIRQAQQPKTFYGRKIVSCQSGNALQTVMGGHPA